MSYPGERIKELREKRGWSQLELAKRANINNSVLSRIESGKRQLEDELLNVFADMFEVSSDYILGREIKNQPMSDSYHKYSLQAFNTANHFKYVKEPGTEYVPINVREAVLEILNQRNMIVHGSPQTNHIPNKTDIILRATLLEAAVSWTREEIMAALTAVQAWRTTKKDIEDATKGLDEEE